jgi:DNA transposition AAA+ family ATPase
MRNVFVRTNNVMNAAAALEELWQGRAGSETNLCLVDGKTGYGKTETLEWYVTQHPGRAVYVRCLDSWSVPAMLRAICRALNLPSRATTERNFLQLEDELKARPRLVILDEADDYVIARGHHLNTVRDLHDRTHTPIVLVGEGSARDLVYRRSPRTWRRMGQVVVFEPLSAPDVQVMAKELCDPSLEIGVALAERLRQMSLSGSFGEVVVNLAKVEAMAKANPDKEITDKMVEMALKARRGGKG